MILASHPIGDEANRRRLMSEAEAIVSRAVLRVRRARVMVVRDRQETFELLAARREDLVRLLGEYQRFKHGKIFNPAMAHGDEQTRTEAAALKTQCILMGEVFGAYHARWFAACRQEWPAYSVDMLEISERLINHLEAEHDSIQRLLV